MAQVASISDTINRADANPAGSPWETISGLTAVKIVSNQLLPAGTLVDVGAAHTSAVLPADQWVQVTLGASFVGDALNYGGLVQRYSSYNNFYYTYYACFGGGTTQMKKRVGGSFSQMGANINAISGTVGDTVSQEVVGSTITLKHNGTTLATRTDTSHGSGTRAGVMAFGSMTTMAQDNFEAGYFSSAGSPNYAYAQQ